VAAIEVEELVRAYPVAGGPPFVAVDRVSFAVRPGEVFGLLGPNGAGKSTVMRILATLLRPTAGVARVAGHDVVRQPDAVRRALGYLSASSGLPARLTCREVLELFAALQQVERPAELVERALRVYAIVDFAGQRVETLSSGMRQRVRIAAAAVHEPPVLILDEPTAGLDVPSADRLLDTIREARDRGAGVVFSTHVLREAAKVCDRIGLIAQGRLVGLGTVAELCAETGSRDLEEAFVARVAR
jgi:sodium transport system ATP-binding protein